MDRHNEFLDQYRNVFNLEKTKQIYLDMEKNNEFELADRMIHEIREANGIVMLECKDTTKGINVWFKHISEKKELRISTKKFLSDQGHSY